jgi:low affinity Fe/Cu permease
MVVNDSLSIGSVLEGIYPLVLDKLSPLIGIFRVVGIAAIVYLMILIVRGIINIKNARRIKRIEEKLDLLIASQKLGSKTKKKE